MERPRITDQITERIQAGIGEHQGRNTAMIIGGFLCITGSVNEALLYGKGPEAAVTAAVGLTWIAAALVDAYLEGGNPNS